MLGLFRWREFVSHSLHEAGSSASGGTLQQCWRPAPGCRAKHFHLITDGSVERTVRSRANSGGMAVGQQVTWLAGRQWSSGRGGFAERRGDGGRVFFNSSLTTLTPSGSFWLAERGQTYRSASERGAVAWIWHKSVASLSVGCGSDASSTPVRLSWRLRRKGCRKRSRASNSRRYRASDELRGTHSMDVALARNAVEIHQAGTVVTVEQDAVWGPRDLPGRPVPGRGTRHRPGP